ncbi:Rieske (2Fe-2S) protein [Gluconobacter wancherniae]|uniref:Rieske (2Fe-2S) protein n=2 Tax=Gluconobacter wancherniae TaxID=1307955 RepID=UPI0027957D7A|nr:Rieske (2Fe-2S) protein [Gluconobacter wancherniae]
MHRNIYGKRIFEMSRWSPVARAMDIELAAVAPARLSRQEIALWREPNRTLHAWEDRCPHRGMHLSFGFVHGNNLTCLYHCWQCDGAARMLEECSVLRRNILMAAMICIPP